MATISYEGEDPYNWICNCKNTSDAAGFFPCDAFGKSQHDEGGRPTPAWGGTYFRCADCGLVINQYTREIVIPGT